jgi:hypothetical protein
MKNQFSKSLSTQEIFQVIPEARIENKEKQEILDLRIRTYNSIWWYLNSKVLS